MYFCLLHKLLKANSPQIELLKIKLEISVGDGRNYSWSTATIYFRKAGL